MNIDVTSVIKSTGDLPVTDANNKVNPVKIEQDEAIQSSIPTATSANQQLSDVNKATGLLQTIILEKISGTVIRKMPTDDYLKLLSLLDEMVSGSLDKRV